MCDFQNVKEILIYKFDKNANRNDMISNLNVFNFTLISAKKNILKKNFFFFFFRLLIKWVHLCNEHLF